MSSNEFNPQQTSQQAKSIQCVFSLASRKNIDKNTQQSLPQLINQAESHKQEEFSQSQKEIRDNFIIPLNQQDQNDINLNQQNHQNIKRDRCYSDESLSDTSTILKPSLFQTGTGFQNRCSSLNRLNSLSNSCNSNLKSSPSKRVDTMISSRVAKQQSSSRVQSPTKQYSVQSQYSPTKQLSLSKQFSLQTPQKEQQNKIQTPKQLIDKNQIDQKQDTFIYYSQYRTIQQPNLNEFQNQFVQSEQKITNEKEDIQVGQSTTQSKNSNNNDENKPTNNSEINNFCSNNSNSGDENISKYQNNQTNKDQISQLENLKLQIFTNQHIQNIANTPQKIQNNKSSQSNNKSDLFESDFFEKNHFLYQSVQYKSAPFGIHLLHSRDQSNNKEQSLNKDQIHNRHSQLLLKQPQQLKNCNILRNVHKSAIDFGKSTAKLHINNKKEDPNKFQQINKSGSQPQLYQKNQNITPIKKTKNQIFFSPSKNTFTKHIVLDIQNKNPKLITTTSSQQIEKNSHKQFNNLLSQAFSQNFSQYNVMETAMTKKLVANIRQKSAKGSCINFSSLQNEKHVRCLTSCDNIENFQIIDEDFDKKYLESEQNNIFEISFEIDKPIEYKNQNQTPLDNEQKQTHIFQKRIFGRTTQQRNQSAQYPSHNQSQQNLKKQKDDKQFINQFYMNMNQLEQSNNANRVLKRTEQTGLFSNSSVNLQEKTSSNYDLKNKEIEKIGSLMKLQHNKQISQLKKQNIEQQKALTKEVNSTKNQSQEGKRNINQKYYQKYQNLQQQIFTDNSNPFYQLSAIASKNELNQNRNGKLKKDFFLENLQQQKQQIDLLQKQFDDKLSLTKLNSQKK